MIHSSAGYPRLIDVEAESSKEEQEQGSWDLGVERAQGHFHYTLG